MFASYSTSLFLQFQPFPHQNNQIHGFSLCPSLSQLPLKLDHCRGAADPPAAPPISDTPGALSPAQRPVNVNRVEQKRITCPLNQKYEESCTRHVKKRPKFRDVD